MADIPNCKFHPGVESTHCVVDKQGESCATYVKGGIVFDIFTSPPLPICEPCSKEIAELGHKVARHQGYLWGLPVFIISEDDILDSTILE